MLHGAQNGGALDRAVHAIAEMVEIGGVARLVLMAVIIAAAFRLREGSIIPALAGVPA